MRYKPLILTACTCLLIPVPAHAEQQNRDKLIVSAPPQKAVTYQKWSKKISWRLNRGIENAEWLYGRTKGEGYARVQFWLDEEGRPKNVTLFEPSGNNQVNRVSMRVVKTLRSLYPLPPEVARDSRFHAWIVIAQSEKSEQAMLNTLHEKYGGNRMAGASEPGTVVLAAR